jgi:mono/diheme cytochrome c family protein
MTRKPFYFIMLGGLVLFLLLVFLVPDSNEPEDQAGETPEEVTFDPAQAFATSCSGCHGKELEGVTGPSLIGLTYKPEEIAEIMTKGKGGMPPNMFTGTEEEKLALANWILEHK